MAALGPRSRGSVGLAHAAIGATLLVSVVACYSPRATHGASEAVDIYRRSARSEGPPRFRGRDASGMDAPAAPVPGKELTADDAILLAKKNSARLAELDARVATAEAAIDAAGQPRNPELRATNVRVGRAIDQGGDGLNLTPRLRLHPERPGEIAAREAQARAARDEARADARAEEMAIEAEIRWLFDDVVLLDAEIAASERAAATRAKLAAQVRSEVGTAMATAMDEGFAALVAVEAEGEVAELRARRELVLAALLERMGMPPRTSLALRGDPAAWPPPPLPTERLLVEHALRQSPTVAGSAARIDAADARLHQEKGRRWPWLNFVEVGYQVESSSTGVPLFTVGAGIELPIFHANGGAVRHAEASRSAARQHLEAEVEQTVRDVRQRRREVETAAALVTEFRTRSLPLVEGARSQMDRALAAGAINTVRALNLEERTNLVELRLFKLVRRYRASLDGLRRAIGGPLPAAR